MALRRRTSSVLETIRQGLAGVKQINPAPDFGGNPLCCWLPCGNHPFHDRVGIQGNLPDHTKKKARI